MTPRMELAVNYDPNADVLYVALGKPVPSITDEDDDGLLVRFAKGSGTPCGVTVIGFASQWVNSTDRLARLVGDHLHIAPKAVADALRSVHS
jgi:uncharacterized protein YuzE